MTPVAAPAVTSWLQLLGLIAVLIYMAYGQSAARQNSALTQSKVDESNRKTDGLHEMWNSRLDEFKRLFSENTRATMEAQRKEFESSITKMHADHEAKVLADRTEFDRRIAAMESTIKAQQIHIAGPSIQPVQIVNPDPIPVVQTPEQRLSEIRGEPK